MDNSPLRPDTTPADVGTASMSLAPASSSNTWGFVDVSTPGNRRAPSTAHSRGSPALVTTNCEACVK
jgi:hypothetical protein